MTYRERLEARLERRREWAAKREARASAVAKEAEKYRGDVAFNTQPGHIPERARLLARQERAWEDSKMAAHHESRADGIERQLDRSIFSDDPDALESLDARIAELEAKRDKMKIANSAYRKGDAAFAAALGITVEQATARRITIEQNYSWQRQPHPAYELTNLGGNIRRLKERIKTVKARQASAEKAEANGGVVIEGVAEYVSITFAEKPDREILNQLKAAGFYWGGGSWNGKREAIPASVSEMAVQEPEPEPDTSPASILAVIRGESDDEQVCR